MTLITRSFVFLFFVLVLVLPRSTKAQYYFEDRWPNLKFFLPVAMHPAPDQSKRIFVLEQTGRVKVFKDSGTVNQGDTTTFIDVRAKLPGGISGGGSETGLLGMAFHPNFTQNGFVYLNYTKSSPTLTTVVSRFTIDAQNPNKLDPASEKVIITVPQPYSNHNGGSILFGDDGYLYIALGDGGSGGDPGNRAQNKSDLLGKILRIDVNVPENNPTPYAIPSDNPFANNTSGWKKEIGCTGMRNPWKITKDPERSTIWIGDVGQGVIEEVDTFRLGANYGWKVMEGNNAYSACGNCDTSNYEKPIFAYTRALGNSVTGGFIYRGKELYKLKGAYIFGDYGSRFIWSLQKGSNGVYQNTLLGPGGFAVSSFGLDHENEVYFIRYSSAAGKLMKIRCGPATPVLTTPGRTVVCQGDSIVMTAPSATGIAGYKWSTGDTTNRIVLRNPGSYSVTLQTRNTFGCWSYASKPLSLGINSKPLKPVVPTLTNCLADTIAGIFSGSPLRYRWSTGRISDSLVFTTPGNYWVYALDSANCKSDTAFFQASFHPPVPTPGLTLTGNTLVTSAQSGATYSWLLNGVQIQSGTDTFLVVNQPGMYQLLATTPAGCRSDTSAPVVLTQVPKAPKVASWVLTPNPFRDVLEIEWPEEFAGKDVRVEFFDLKGTLVKREILKSVQAGGSKILETGNLPKGVYTLKVQSGNSRFVKKMVKD